MGRTVEGNLKLEKQTYSEGANSLATWKSRKIRKKQINKWKLGICPFLHVSFVGRGIQGFLSLAHKRQLPQRDNLAVDEGMQIGVGTDKWVYVVSGNGRTGKGSRKADKHFLNKNLKTTYNYEYI